MSHLFYKIKSDDWHAIVSKLSKMYSLPIINHNLAIYVQTGKQALEIGFINNKCYLRERDSSSFKSTPYISIENKNIKFFLEILNNLSLNSGMINEIIQLDYYRDGVMVVSLKLGTLIGDLLVVNKDFYLKVAKLLKDIIHDYMNSEELDSIVTKKNLPEEPLFNHLNAPNAKIKNYTDRFAIDLSSGITTLSNKISVKSNDYNIYEEYFESLTGSKLDSDSVSSRKSSYFKPMSIVIPSLNSDKTIMKTLFSIESQDLSKNKKAKLDVIVVDDGSKNRVVDIVEPYLKRLSFKPRIVRLEENQGLSVARNMGFKLSMYDHILFMDSDVLLAKNYLYEHSIRLQLIPNALFISFKENIPSDSKLTELSTIVGGLPISKTLNDKRISRMVESDTRWPNKIVNEGTQELLGETNLFKNFGYGRTINGCFDLPSMVVGHNMTMSRDIVASVGGFSNHFAGWGLEDAFWELRPLLKVISLFQLFQLTYIT